MKQHLRTFILAVLFISALTGCGGGQTDTSTTPKTSSLIVYQFTARIESYIDSTAPFPAAVGDVITGTFSYDPISDLQYAPAGVQVNIGGITLNSDLSSIISQIIIINDQPQPGIGDAFMFGTYDTNIAAQYGLDSLLALITLDDTTATAFSDSKIPTHLSLSQFNNAFISISKYVHGVGGYVFCRAPITSLNRLQ